MADEIQRPDAIQFPLGWDPGGSGQNSEDRRWNYLAATLGGRPHIYVMPTTLPVFVTLSPFDTINFPNGHDRQGFPRYDWVPQSNGCTFGYLKPEAKIQ